MRKVMGMETHIKAYALKEHLQAAAERHPASGAATAVEYVQVLNSKASGICSILEPAFVSSQLQPEGTLMLRTAVKVNRAWEIGAWLNLGLLCDCSSQLGFGTA